MHQVMSELANFRLVEPDLCSLSIELSEMLRCLDLHLLLAALHFGLWKLLEGNHWLCGRLRPLPQHRP